jgi:hypothetical protein
MPALTARRRHALTGFTIALVFVMTTYVMYRPTAHAVSSTLPWNLGDPALNTWIVSWQNHALWHDAGHYFNGNMFYPFGDSLLYSELILPLVPVFSVVIAMGGSPIVAHNVGILLLALLCLTTTYLLAHRLLARRDVAVLSALMFSFSGYVFMHVGHLQLLTLGFFPLALLVLFVTLERPTIVHGVLLGLATFALTTGCLYYGAIWGLSLVAVLATELIRQRARPGRPWWTSLGAAALIAGFLLAPIALAYMRFQHRVGFRRPLVPSYGLNPRDLITPAAGTWLYRGLLERASRAEPATVEHGFFLGFSTWLLAGIGLVTLVIHAARRRQGRSDTAEPANGTRWHELHLMALVAVVSLVMAIGPTVLGHPAPFRVFYDYVPGFNGMQAVARLALPALLFVAILAALGLDRLLRATSAVLRLAVVVAVSIVVLCELYVSPIRAPVDQPAAATAVYARLRAAGPGPAIELPVFVPALGGLAPIVEGPRMLASLGDWRERVNGFSGGYPPGYYTQAALFNRFPAPEAVEAMRQIGLRFVILHVGDQADRSYPEAKAQQIVDALPLGMSAERVGSTWLIALP